MSSVVMTSQEFNRHVSKAQRDCENNPVFVTNRGNLSCVLLSYSEYKRLLGKGESIADALAVPPEEVDIADIEFDRVLIEDDRWTGA